MDADIEQLIRYLVAHLKCVACQGQYSIDDFQVLEKGTSMLILLMTCQHCQTQGLLMAFVQEQQMEPKRNRRSAEGPELGPITIDDVLDIHRLLAHFEGDCNALLTG
jgi:hypothetical protein